MVKILAGMLAAIRIAVAGFFGFEFYVQRQVAGEVEAAFAAVRESGAKASHGPVSFDLWSRTVVVADIAGESAAQPPVSVKIGRFTASGVSQPEAGRFSAERIEASEVDLPEPCRQAQIGSPTGAADRDRELHGPPAAAPVRSGRPADVHRRVQHLPPSAASITAPTITGRGAGPSVRARRLQLFGRVDARHPRRPDRHDGDRPRDIHRHDGGRRQEGEMTGEVVDVAAYDFDAAATLAIFNRRARTTRSTAPTAR